MCGVHTGVFGVIGRSPVQRHQQVKTLGNELAHVLLIIHSQFESRRSAVNWHRRKTLLDEIFGRC